MMQNELAFAPQSASIAEFEQLGEGRQAQTFGWCNGAVVKLFRSANDRTAALREAAAMQALMAMAMAMAMPIPMPRLIGTVTIEARPGIVMERLNGPDQLSQLGRKPWMVWTAATNLARLHAQLHAGTAPDALPPLKSSVEEEIASSDIVPDDCKLIASQALARLPDGDAICHWDFHPGNVIEAGEGPKVIDWANVRRGRALADVARTLLILEGGALPPGAPFVVRTLTALGRAVLTERYLDEYRRLSPFQPEELALWRIVSAVSRLSYGLVAEREQLLALIRRPSGQSESSGR